MRPDLTAFAGLWRVARVIRHADGQVARFSGQAEWRAEGDGWRSAEVGTLTQGATAFEARRETLWQADGDTIAVSFADGRPFHHIPPVARPRATHDCPPDDYRLAYDFTAWPHWSVRWRVTGPRKDYRALTRYARITP
ncbi:DUF6314 family protein [Jannaschia sp. 2305UL9-9]|uniref:DUF6314 family protein n=1 Tax=Jannaschia sp. 2305UL9-9 TaxID=3121638 RepID=UPI0035289EC4